MSRWRPTPALKARRIAGNAAGVVGIELLAAAQGVRLPRAAEELAGAGGGAGGDPAQRRRITRRTAISPTISRWAQEAVLAGTLSGEVEAELFGR